MPTEFDSYLLVVDDSDEDLFLFKRLVHRSGVALPCQSATGAAPAMALLTAAIRGEMKARPQACFLDIKMPGQNGFDLLAWIRREPLLNATPVIMLSSSDDPSDVEQARRLGAQCYLAKYPATSTLVQAIADAAAFPKDPAVFNKPYNLLQPHSKRR